MEERVKEKLIRSLSYDDERREQRRRPEEEPSQTDNIMSRSLRRRRVF
jgi:hypothetical protein